MHLFISHASKDAAREALALVEALEALGHRCWIAPRDVRPGIPYQRQIVDAVEKSQGLVLLVSRAANDSADVLQEVQLAAAKKLTIAPVVLAGTEPGADLRYYVSVRHQIAWTNAGAAARALGATFSTPVLGEAPRAPARVAAPQPRSSEQTRVPRWVWPAGIAAMALVGVLVWAPWRSLGPPASSPATVQDAGTEPASGTPADSGAADRADAGGDAGGPSTPAQNPCDAADQAWAGLSASTDQRRIERFVADTPASCNARSAANARLAELRRPQPSGNRDCAECPEMVAIPAGSFTMGSPASEPGREANEGPQHSETVRAFAASKYEITFAQWDACVAGGGCGGYRPADQGWGRGNRPAINVSWNDARAYVQWLSQRTGQRYRLLSEAEWEYAARAGTTTAYSTGSSISASQARFSSQSTAEVGSYPANRFGLHDMHGMSGNGSRIVTAPITMQPEIARSG